MESRESKMHVIHFVNGNVKNIVINLKKFNFSSNRKRIRKENWIKKTNLYRNIRDKKKPKKNIKIKMKIKNWIISPATGTHFFG